MNNGPKIHFPSEEENRQAMAETFRRVRDTRREMRNAATLGNDALKRLMDVLKENHHTGQPYKLRALLYSLWNGKPASLVEVVSLDLELRRDLALVIAGFGYEDKEVKFFYDAIRDGFKNAGLFDWFVEEGETKGGVA